MQLMKSAHFVPRCFMPGPEWILLIGRADVVFVVIWKSDPASAALNLASATAASFRWERYTWFKLKPVVENSLEYFVAVEHMLMSIAGIVK
jgi:hypothetical protein